MQRPGGRGQQRVCTKRADDHGNLYDGRCPHHYPTQPYRQNYAGSDRLHRTEPGCREGIVGCGGDRAEASPIKAVLRRAARQRRRWPASAGRSTALLGLRDGLYRACEAYANGAIGADAYALVLSRYGQLMTTFFLGQDVTGAAGTNAGPTVQSPPVTVNLPGSRQRPCRSGSRPSRWRVQLRRAAPPKTRADHRPLIRRSPAPQGAAPRERGLSVHRAAPLTRIDARLSHASAKLDWLRHCLASTIAGGSDAHFQSCRETSAVNKCTKSNLPSSI